MLLSDNNNYTIVCADQYFASFLALSHDHDGLIYDFLINEYFLLIYVKEN